MGITGTAVPHTALSTFISASLRRFQKGKCSFLDSFCSCLGEISDPVRILVAISGHISAQAMRDAFVQMDEAFCSTAAPPENDSGCTGLL